MYTQHTNKPAYMAGKLLLWCLAWGLPLLLNAQGGYLDNPAWPGGNAEKRARAAIETINANDANQIEAFARTHFAKNFLEQVPMQAHLDALLSFYRETGGVDFHSTRTYEPSRPGTTIILKSRLMGSWHGLTLAFDDKEEGRIAGIFVGPARIPTNAKEPELTEAQAIKEVNAIIDRLCGKDIFSGTVLIAKADKILLERVCGEACKSFHAKNDMDTKFNLGSMNKMFTAVAIAQLAEQNKLSYTDPISRYIDESWLPKSITDKVTVHHLLTHTSGLGSYFNETYDKSSRELFKALSDYKPLVNGDTLAFEPGTDYAYSNTGMLLLGVVIEKASGQDYFNYIRRHIYEPTGMKNSDCYELDFPIENLAVGYIPVLNNPYKWQTNTFKHVIKGGPAGGGYSTVRDLYQFARALQTDKLVKPATRELLWTDHSGAGYGYGFGLNKVAGGDVVGHNGGFPGLNSELAIMLKQGYIVAVMSNYDNGASPLAGRILQMLGGVK